MWISKNVVINVRINFILFQTVIEKFKGAEAVVRELRLQKVERRREEVSIISKFLKHETPAFYLIFIFLRLFQQHYRYIANHRNPKDLISSDD